MLYGADDKNSGFLVLFHRKTRKFQNEPTCLIFCMWTALLLKTSHANFQLNWPITFAGTDMCLSLKIAPSVPRANALRARYHFLWNFQNERRVTIFCTHSGILHKTSHTNFQPNRLKKTYPARMLKFVISPLCINSWQRWSSGLHWPWRNIIFKKI